MRYAVYLLILLFIVFMLTGCLGSSSSEGDPEISETQQMINNELQAGLFTVRGWVAHVQNSPRGNAFMVVLTDGTEVEMASNGTHTYARSSCSLEVSTRPTRRGVESGYWLEARSDVPPVFFFLAKDIRTLHPNCVNVPATGCPVLNGNGPICPITGQPL